MIPLLPLSLSAVWSFASILHQKDSAVILVQNRSNVKVYLPEQAL